MQGRYTPSPDGAGSVDTSSYKIRRLLRLRDIAWNARPGPAEEACIEALGPEMSEIENELWRGRAGRGPVLDFRMQEVFDGVRGGDYGPHFDRKLLAVISDLSALALSDH